MKQLEFDGFLMNPWPDPTHAVLTKDVFGRFGYSGFDTLQEATYCFKALERSYMVPNWQLTKIELLQFSNNKVLKERSVQ
jgi:hypothetical protein